MSDTNDDLVEGQSIQALVKLGIEEMIEKPRKFLVDYLAMHALGKEAIGVYYLDEFMIDPVGMIHKEVVFEVSGIVRKHAKIQKKKKPSKKSSTKKKVDKTSK